MAEPTTDLIPLSIHNIGDVEQTTVNGRDLHTFLGVKSRYAEWVTIQVRRGRFVQGRDYEVFLVDQKNRTGGRPSTYHVFTTDAAKQIGMLSGTERGVEIREYFLACERRVYQLERTPQPVLEDQFDAALKLLAKWHTLGEAFGADRRTTNERAAEDIFERIGFDVRALVPPATLALQPPQPSLAPATTFQKSFTPVDANGNEVPDGMHYNMEADPVRRLVTNESWLSPMHFGMYLRLHGDNQGQTFNMMLGIIGWQKQNTAKVWIPTQLGTPHCRQRKYNLEWQVGPVKAELGHCKNVDDLFSTRPEFRRVH